MCRAVLLIIIASMERELSGLRRGGKFVVSSHSSDLRVVGVGRSRSQRGLRGMLNSGLNGTPRSVLFLGFAGAVAPELESGDLILPSRYYVETPGEKSLAPDPEMRQQAILAAANAGLVLHHLDSLTVGGIVSTSAAKAALYEEYPVGIVGMEDYWLAVVAHDAGVPFVSVRAVLDTAHQRLPRYLLGLSQGRPLDVLRTVVMPWRVPTLVRLNYQAHIARKSLIRFAYHFSRQLDKEGRASVEADVAVAV